MSDPRPITARDVQRAAARLLKWPQDWSRVGVRGQPCLDVDAPEGGPRGGRCLRFSLRPMRRNDRTGRWEGQEWREYPASRLLVEGLPGLLPDLVEPAVIDPDEPLGGIIRFTAALQAEFASRRPYEWHETEQAADTARLLAIIDRSVAKLGPDTIVYPVRALEPTPAGAFRPKGTDEVAPPSADPRNGNKHGGDGASGEVEGGQPTAFPGGESNVSLTSAAPAAGQPRDMGGDAGVEPDESCSDTGREAAPEEARKQPPCAHSGKLEGSNPSPSGDGEVGIPPAQDVLPPESPTGAADAETGVEAPQANEPENSGGADAPPVAAYRSLRSGRVSSQSNTAVKRGGLSYAAYARLADYKAKPALVARARRALRRLVGDGAMEDGPRRDWPEFAERLLAHRPLAPARREEQGRPAILVMVDVSGSCSGLTNVSIPVAQAAAELGVPGADVIVVAHSNGYPYECKVNRAAPVDVTACPWYRHAAHGDDWPTVLGNYDALLAKYDLRVVIALGDWDAHYVYAHLAARPCVQRFIWLDNYGGRMLAEMIFSRHAADWSSAARRKTRYVVGPKTAEDFVDELERVARAQ